MGQNKKSESTTQSLPQFYADKQSSHSCDELFSNHEYPPDRNPSKQFTSYGNVYSHIKTTDDNMFTTARVRSTSLLQYEPIVSHSNNQTKQIHSTQETASSISSIVHQNNNSNMENQPTTERRNNQRNKGHISEDKVQTDGKYTVLAPLGTTKVRPPANSVFTDQTIQRNENVRSHTNQNYTDQNKGLLTEQKSNPETGLESLYTSSTPDILLHNASVSNANLSSTTHLPSNNPQTPIIENPVRKNNASSRSRNLEMSRNDTPIYASTDDTLDLDRSGYSIEDPNFLTRKLKTKRRVSSDLSVTAVFDTRYISPDRQANTNKNEENKYIISHQVSKDVKSPSHTHGKSSDRDTSDSVSVNSSVVGLKRERLSSRGRNGSFAATKYDKMKSPSSQSFAGFPQHARQYSSTSDDQSFTNNTYSTAKSFATKTSSHGSIATDESRTRRYKLGYAKAKGKMIKIYYEYESKIFYG